jgi:hypothetical protein
MVVIGAAGLITCSGPTPPSCAEDGGGSSMNSQTDCLSKVGDWCQKNYPNDLACSDRVYGYVPGEPGDPN